MNVKLYAITYINNKGNTVTKKLTALNRFFLTMEIFQEIKDFKDNNSDNIIAIEEV